MITTGPVTRITDEDLHGKISGILDKWFAADDLSDDRDDDARHLEQVAQLLEALGIIKVEEQSS